MKASELKHLADSKKDIKVGVFNPTNKDFTWQFDGKGYTIPKGEMIKLDYPIAQHMAKHLIDKILTDKGVPTNKEVARKEWEKKILI